MATIKVTDESFEAKVLGSPLPVLVDFWATWCGPCLAVAPVLERLSEEYEGKLIIAKLDVDEAPVTAQRFRIQSIPTMILFEGGKLKTGVQGALPHAQLVEFIESQVSTLAPPSISAPELKKLLETNGPVALYDVRDAGSFSRSHLRRSERMETSALDAAIKSLPAGRRAVLICRTGDDSGEEAARLAAEGLPVVALENGLLSWEGNGFPTYSDKEEQELEA